jgi:beta-1,4-mannooligosaccharide/beta-1,4-mannosyl-N-acetylglucosamine phosphorylase
MVLFPEKSGDGRYMRLDRPNLSSKGGKGDIWLAHSPDLVHWGDARLVISSSDVPLIAYHGLGPSTNPVRVDDGWLIVFHTIMGNCTTKEYAVAAAILDADQPWIVRHLTEHPVLWPQAEYELTGLVEHVCFPCSMIVEDDGTLKLYYGGADYVQCVAVGTVDDLVYACKNW